MGGPVRVYSAHTGRSDECQLERVGEIVRARQGNSVSMLMGDFNTPETSKALTILRSDASFIDAFRTVNPDIDGPTVWQRIDSPEPTASRRVDFILLLNGQTSKASVRSSRLVFNKPGRLSDGRVLWPSDHYGVLADIDLIRESR